MASNSLFYVPVMGVIFVFFGAVVVLDIATSLDFGPLGVLAWIVVIGGGFALMSNLIRSEPT